MIVQPDIPRLYTALAEWLACLVTILLMRRKVGNVRLVCAAVLGLILQCAVQLVAGMLPLALWVPGMVLAAALMAFSFRSMSSITVWDCLYYTARAFTLAEFAAALEWQLHSYYLNDSVGAAGSFLFLSAAYGVIFGGYYLLNRKLFKRYVSNTAPREAISSLLTAAVVFLISNLSYLNLDTPFRGEYSREIFYIRSLVDLCGLVLLLSQQEQHTNADARYELGAMQLVLHQQYEQYRQTKESIDLVNRKYHDLKHQISVIRAENSPEKRESYLRDMEHGIRMVDAQYKTGNDVLDTVLSGKAMYCAKHDISMNCVVDGTLLSKMEVMDICSLFGNALDNAIECVEALDAPEKRLVRVAVCAQQGLTLLRFENYCDTPLQFEDGTPRTTKGDWGYHGYGVKSIRSIAEKYGGSMTIRTQDNWFRLCILLPREAAF